MLQIQTVKPDCLAVLKELMSLSELGDFRLAGGTALSLRLGHRISVDIDLFTNTLFDPEVLQTFLQNYFSNRIELLGSNKYGVFGAIDGIKVDFFSTRTNFANSLRSYGKLRTSAEKIDFSYLGAKITIIQQVVK